MKASEEEYLLLKEWYKHFAKNLEERKDMKIKKVIFNNPYTIILWKDGSKTMVKCTEDETYDPEKGMALAICKKVLGTNISKSNYYDIFKEWLPKEEKKPLKKYEPDFREFTKREMTISEMVDFALSRPDVCGIKNLPFYQIDAYHGTEQEFYNWLYKTFLKYCGEGVFKSAKKDHRNRWVVDEEEFLSILIYYGKE